jgi:exopolyphosphatase/pppGpp-phosphohydrolase
MPEPPAFGLVILSAFLVMTPNGASAQTQTSFCAIDMGSNTFRRIVGTFANGRYVQRTFERQTLGVGDDVARNGQISEAKLAEIAVTLRDFKKACDGARAAPVRAVGTWAFRVARNGRRAVEIAAAQGVAMEIASEAREAELAFLAGSLGRDDVAVIDNGSRSIELVSRDGGGLRHVVFDLGYRMAYETFFGAAKDPAAAVLAFRERLLREAAKAPFMKGKRSLVGVEFAEMAEVLFDPAPIEGRVFTLETLSAKLRQITSAGQDGFRAVKQIRDIDRALPRLVVAVTLAEAFGYSELAVTERELGTGLIIEAGTPRKP